MYAEWDSRLFGGSNIKMWIDVDMTGEQYMRSLRTRKVKLDWACGCRVLCTVLLVRSNFDSRSDSKAWQIGRRWKQDVALEMNNETRRDEIEKWRSTVTKILSQTESEIDESRRRCEVGKVKRWGCRAKLSGDCTSLTYKISVETILPRTSLSSAARLSSEVTVQKTIG